MSARRPEPSQCSLRALGAPRLDSKRAHVGRLMPSTSCGWRPIFVRGTHTSDRTRASEGSPQPLQTLSQPSEGAPSSSFGSLYARGSARACSQLSALRSGRPLLSPRRLRVAHRASTALAFASRSPTASPAPPASSPLSALDARRSLLGDFEWRTGRRPPWSALC